MRLLHEEHRDLIRVLTHHGYQLNENCRLIKRKGWIHVQCHDREGSFAYFRSRKSQLINGRFQDQISYEVRFGQTHTASAAWNEVLRHFKEWMTNL